MRSPRKSDGDGSCDLTFAGVPGEEIRNAEAQEPRRGLQGARGVGCCEWRAHGVGLAAEYVLHPTMIHQWKKAPFDGAADVFERGGKKPAAQVDDEALRSLHAKIGELAVAHEFFAKAQAVDRRARRRMIERDHPELSVGIQCRLLPISRSSFYHGPAGKTELNLDPMRLNIRQFLDTPFYGVRQMTLHLQNEGHAVNRQLLRRLMRLMRLMPIYQKPNISKPRKGHKTYGYQLCELRVVRPVRVWCADITYLPMRRGFLDLVAIMDWFTRKVLA